MKNLLQSIVENLVANPNAVEITEDTSNADGVTVYNVKVDEAEAGRVIGKEGSVIGAIRKIMRSIASKNGTKVSINVVTEQTKDK